MPASPKEKWIFFFVVEIEKNNPKSGRVGPQKTQILKTQS
jgi:hypothetical protein